MTVIDEQYLQKLRDRGLYVSEAYPATHCWAGGVMVGKPSNVPGNHIADYSAEIELAASDAPPVVLCVQDGEWLVIAQDHNPTPGRGDFTDVWTGPEQAINDILDFYFGDAARMKVKAEVSAEVDKKIAAFLAKKEAEI